MRISKEFRNDSILAKISKRSNNNLAKLSKYEFKKKRNDPIRFLQKFLNDHFKSILNNVTSIEFRKKRNDAILTEISKRVTILLFQSLKLSTFVLMVFHKFKKRNVKISKRSSNNDNHKFKSQFGKISKIE